MKFLITRSHFWFTEPIAGTAGTAKDKKKAARMVSTVSGMAVLRQSRKLGLSLKKLKAGMLVSVCLAAMTTQTVLHPRLMPRDPEV
jgi:hypothetical protein